MEFNPLTHFKERITLESDTYFPGRAHQRERMEVNHFVQSEDIFFDEFTLVTGQYYVCLRSHMRFTFISGVKKEMNKDYAVEITLTKEFEPWGYLKMQVELVKMSGGPLFPGPVRLEFRQQPVVRLEDWRPVNMEFSIWRGWPGWCLHADGCFGNDPGERFGRSFVMIDWSFTPTFGRVLLHHLCLDSFSCLDICV